MPQRRLTLAVVALLVLVFAACGDDAPVDPIVFGEGEVPETMPASVPVPEGAVIGSTLVDRVNNRTEMSVQARRDFEDLVRFYSVELVNAGFLIDESAGDSTRWTIQFSDGDLVGDVIATPAGAGLSRAVIGVNRS